jgi:hypothetical protein
LLLWILILRLLRRVCVDEVLEQGGHLRSGRGWHLRIILVKWPDLDIIGPNIVVLLNLLFVSRVLLAKGTYLVQWQCLLPRHF